MPDMTDAEVRRQKARIKRLVFRWKAALGLERWSITHEFYRGPIPDAQRPGAWDGPLAETKADFRYLHAAILWSLEEVAEVDDDELRRHVVHEFAHCLTDEFKRYALRELGEQLVMDHAAMERQTTEIELAILYAYREGMAEGRKAEARRKAAGVHKTAENVLT